MFGTLPNGPNDPFLSTATRLIAEAIGSNDAYLPAVTRLVLEAIGSTDVYGQRLTRTVAEIIGSNDNINLTVNRLVAEVISENPYILPPILVRMPRLIVETIGASTLTDGKFVTTTREIAEVVTDAALRAKGLKLTAPGGASATLLLAFSPESWASGGEIGLYQQGLERISVRNTGSTTLITVSAPGQQSQATIATPTGKNVLSIRTGLTPAGTTMWLNSTQLGVASTGNTGQAWATAFQPDLLAGQRDASSPHGFVLGEFMLWNLQLTDPQENYERAYLRCKWVTAGCNVNTDLPTKP